jgi:protoheme IX farnesyltransferase
LPADVALWFGVFTALAGLSILTVFVDPLTALLAAIALQSYVLVYTPLKRITPYAMHVGAVPGAIPPVMGWTSMTGAIEPAAWVLFGILFVWQLPHFSAIALFRQREYEQAGVQVLPAVKGIPATKRAIVRYCILMLAVSLLPLLVGLGGILYTAGAVLFGVIFLGYAIYGFKARAVGAWARSLFLLSMPYLVLLLALLVVSRFT